MSIANRLGKSAIGWVKNGSKVTRKFALEYTHNGGKWCFESSGSNSLPLAASVLAKFRLDTPLLAASRSAKVLRDGLAFGFVCSQRGAD